VVLNPFPAIDAAHPIEGLRAASAIAETLAQELAAEHYGLTVTAHRLNSERDQNFRLRAPDGRDYVLKIANPAEDPAVTNLQTAALLHLAESDPTLPIPRVFAATNGTHELAIPFADGSTRVVRLLSFLAGAPMHTIAGSTRLRRDLGRCAARLARGLCDFSHPGANHKLLWDLQNAAELRPLINAVPVDRRALVERYLDGFETNALPALAGLSRQPVHNDLNPHNIVVDPGNSECVSGIIDFGDLTSTARVNDLAIAAAYQVADCDDPLAPACDLIAAYHAVSPLDPAEFEVLLDLIATRMVMTIVVSSWRAACYPENRDYILRNNSSAWARLNRIARLPRGQAMQQIRRAGHSGMRPMPADDKVISTPDMIARRNRLLGPAYRLFYEQPVHFVRGEGVWLYDAAGQPYLDAYNNVACVGHCHPHVVQAIARQAAVLNTHTRYLDETVLDYAEKLLATFPAEIGHVMFTCTGSEANDLALRVARTCTGGSGFIVTETAYHGVTSALVELSPSLGLPKAKDSHARFVPAPRPAGDETGEVFARHVRDALDDMKRNGIRPAGLLVDTIFSSDGVFADPAGFLRPAVDSIRAAGGLFIADEVQPGFGRTGEEMWGFARHGLVPDLATMGKPMGNGHPVAAMAARPELLAEFGARSRYFNTFGGNPVSAAAGIAVLEVIASEGLVENARRTGAYLCERLRQLQARHELIAEIRGAGLFIGVELRRGGITGAPATSESVAIVNMLRARGVLISAAGPHGNVLKIRPPLVFRTDHADLLVERLDQALLALPEAAAQDARMAAPN
jgi:4-aminobutyrate aminotransferase-like enzyme/Ser/Thr protein kinase RdoA (MazF antagonist)